MTANTPWGSRKRSRSVLVLAFLVIQFFSVPGTAQINSSAISIAVDPFPTGIRPLGVSVSSGGFYYVAVANAGDDSISLFQLTSDTATRIKTLRFVRTIPNIPSPYAVSFCSSGDRFLVSSPFENSVRVIRVPDGAILATIPVGQEPRAVTCFRGIAVSNAGDNTLTIIDPVSLAVQLQWPMFLLRADCMA
jgi:DNA-binding beta-propeller fold protein YncE